MSTISAPLGVGDLLRDWRQRRRLSQLDLSNEAAVSARHLSFVETGRSKPSRELVLHLAEHLDVPLRERNSLLMAAGYAPVYRERSLDDAEMDPVRGALDMILAGHEPYPAVIVDRLWNLVTANTAALSLFATGVAQHLLEPPVNVIRLGVHPEGLAPRTRNLAEFSEHLLVRLQRQLAVSPDAELQALYDEVLTYPGVTSHSPVVADPTTLLFVPMQFVAVDGQELSMFSTLATFGTALDITLAELSIESFFPADAATEAYFKALTAHVGEQLVEALVALDDAGLHAAGDDGVAVLEAVARATWRRGGCGRRSSGSSVSFSRATWSGIALEGEGLHDELGRPHLVEAAVEAVLLAVAAVDVAVLATGAAVQRVDLHRRGRAGRATARSARGRCGPGTPSRAGRRTRGRCA